MSARFKSFRRSKLNGSTRRLIERILDGTDRRRKKAAIRRKDGGD